MKKSPVLAIAVILVVAAFTRTTGDPAHRAAPDSEKQETVHRIPAEASGCEVVLGGITRMDSTKKELFLVFTGHEFGDGGAIIRTALKRHGAKASFFFTGDFYRQAKFRKLIRRLQKDGHYLGGHSDKHLLYAPWERRDSLLVTKAEFLGDLHANYNTMGRFGITAKTAPYFMPPFEWYNQTISDWCGEEGLTLINYTPGTSSNADYTTPEMGKQYQGSDSIYTRILRYESTHTSGLNGFILLTHIGTDPRRTDKFYSKLDALITELERRGYRLSALRKGR